MNRPTCRKTSLSPLYTMRLSALRKILLGVALITFILSGCSYRAGRIPPPLSPNLNTLAIPIFENASSEPLIETALTEALREKFINDGRLRVVTEEKADLVLKGKITAYGIRTLAFDASDRAMEARVIVDVKVDVVKRRGDGKPVSFELQGRSEYIVSERLSQLEKAKEAAERRAFKELADKFAELLFLGL